MFELWLVLIFVFGYLIITLEPKVGINKAATAILVGVICWVFNFVKVFPHNGLMIQRLNEHLADISQIVVFVLGTMTIVELIDVHRGFDFICDLIKARNQRQLLWAVSFITFFLSAFLANMTTAIIMISLMRQFVGEKQERMIFASMIIVASNAGGAWTPIGDTTTTMLWIGGQISTWKIMRVLFIPSVISMLIPLIYFSTVIPNTKIMPLQPDEQRPVIYKAKTILILGIGATLCIPVLTAFTNIPPYMGVLLVLGMMWGLTDLLNQERHFLRVPHVLTKVDISSVLFFLGILLMIAALETAGILRNLAVGMDAWFGNKNIIVFIMGIISSVIDNIPLTAATMGMYSLTSYPMDSRIWEMVAYCVGTGGSILVIGSAAGVVAMGMERIGFLWYLKKVSLPVFVGYSAGAAVLFLLYRFS